MGLRIKTNVASLNSQNRMKLTTHDLGENMAKLASGYRVNKAADDAAGLAISESMRARIRSLGQAKRNANDAISLVQVAEGGFNEMSNILIRLRELAIQASSDTIGNNERTYVNQEYVQLVKEIGRIANSTEFNGVKLFGGPDSTNDPSMFVVHVGAGNEESDRMRIGIETLHTSPEVFELGVEDEIGPKTLGDDFERDRAAQKLPKIDQALKRIATSRAFLGAQQNRLQSTIVNIGTQVENLEAAKSRIRDVDFAEETALYTQNRILQQAGSAVLKQANQSIEIALSLLQ